MTRKDDEMENENCLMDCNNTLGLRSILKAPPTHIKYIITKQKILNPNVMCVCVSFFMCSEIQTFRMMSYLRKWCTLC